MEKQKSLEWEVYLELDRLRNIKVKLEIDAKTERETEECI